MFTQNHKLYVLGLLAACGLAGCHRTVIRSNAPAGERPSEVTVSSPDTAKVEKKTDVVVTPEKKTEVVVTPSNPAPAPSEIVVVRPADPPPPPADIRVASPAPDYVWVAGAYDWRNNSWQWVPGHWERPTQPTMTWEPGRWESAPGGYVWRPGHWR